jgi:hypothetical protein
MEDSAASQEGGVAGEEGWMGSPPRRSEASLALEAVRISTGEGKKVLYLLVFGSVFASCGPNLGVNSSNPYVTSLEYLVYMMVLVDYACFLSIKVGSSRDMVGFCGMFVCVFQDGEIW